MNPMKRNFFAILLMCSSVSFFFASQKIEPIDEFLHRDITTKTSNLCQQVFAIEALQENIESYLNRKEIETDLQQALDKDYDNSYSHEKIKQLFALGLLYQNLNLHQEKFMPMLFSVNSSQKNLVEVIIENHDITSFNVMLRNELDVNEYRWNKMSMLARACSCRAQKIVQILVENGCCLEEQKSYTSFKNALIGHHTSPLYAAIVHGKSDSIAQYLIDHGADPSDIIDRKILIPQNFELDIVISQDSV